MTVPNDERPGMEALVMYADKHDKIITEWVPADRLRLVPDGG